MKKDVNFNDFKSVSLDIFKVIKTFFFLKEKKTRKDFK